MTDIAEQVRVVAVTLSPTMRRNLTRLTAGEALNKAQSFPLVSRGLVVSHEQQELTLLGKTLVSGGGGVSMMKALFEALQMVHDGTPIDSDHARELARMGLIGVDAAGEQVILPAGFAALHGGLS